MRVIIFILVAVLLSSSIFVFIAYMDTRQNITHTEQIQIKTDSDVYDDTRQNTTHTEQTWIRTDPSEFRTDPAAYTTVASYTTTNPYEIKRNSALVIIGTITWSEEHKRKRVFSNGQIFYQPYTKYFVDVDHVLNGSYTSDTIEIINEFHSKIDYQKGDQAFFMLSDANHTYIDAWWPNAQMHGMFKIKNGSLIGDAKTIIDKNSLIDY